MSLQDIYQNVINGQAADVQAGVQSALSQGIAAEEILHKGLIAARTILVNGPGDEFFARAAFSRD